MSTLVNTPSMLKASVLACLVMLSGQVHAEQVEVEATPFVQLEPVEKIADDYDIQAMTPEAIFEHGRLSRAQFHYQRAEKYLRAAADQGIVPAAYLYAVLVSDDGNKLDYSPVAQQYLTQAAKADYIPAMKLLVEKGHWLSANHRTIWRYKYEEALAAWYEKAPKDAAFSLYQYIYPTDKKKAEQYLEEAIAANDVDALLHKASQIELAERGFYLFPSSRLDAAAEVKKQIANAGGIPGTKSLYRDFIRRGESHKAVAWREKAIEQGDLMSLAALGRLYTTNYMPEDAEYTDGLVYLSAYLDVVGQGRFVTLREQAMEQFELASSRVSNDVIEKVEQRAAELRRTHIFFHYDRYWQKTALKKEPATKPVS
ncbi:sel1 repeat family protein [Salinivibrio sp. AR647]|uniref:sel1 repeat family protein n=1 Tax=Salinivibrio sp. AR647 TaxID=1909438 RepID=UPI00105600AC|nr:sel1 repeat family protein [Salinivibrio sp. AR647]